MSSSAHAQQPVIVTNLKLYGETDSAYLLDIPGLRHPVTRSPASIPKIMIESLEFSADRTLVLAATMERWIAEQNGFEYAVLSSGKP